MSEAISKFSGLAKGDIYFWFRESIPKMTQQTQEMRNLSAPANDPIDSGGAAYLGADDIVRTSIIGATQSAQQMFHFVNLDHLLVSSKCEKKRH